uniref:Uncharacterized protein n=1 Tax=Romanomermis culicivorax TaxID=13658 RepID=A0A915J7E7_ROMCU
LQLILTIDEKEFTRSSEDVGFSVLITQQHETPLPHILGIKVDPAFITHISLSQIDEKKSRSSRYCEAADDYTVEACRIGCSQRNLMHYCNCTDPWDSINVDSVCLIGQKQCVEAYHENCYPNNAEPCECPPKCQTTFYKQFFTKTRMNAQTMMQMCNKKWNDRNASCLNVKQMSIIYVYYETETSLAYTEIGSY